MQPSHAFTSSPPVTLKSLVTQISETNVRALQPTEYDDVITILEYIRGEALKAHQANDTREAALAERERAVAKREQDVALRSKAVDAALKVAPRKRRYLPW